MKVSTAVLIIIGLVSLLFGADLALKYSRKVAITRDLIAERPNLTPVQTLAQYFQLASENRIEDVALFVTKTPRSYWIRCKGNDELVPSFRAGGLKTSPELP